MQIIAYRWKKKVCLRSKLMKSKTLLSCLDFKRKGNDFVELIEEMSLKGNERC